MRWLECECVDVAGSDRGEVPSVERCDGTDVEAFGECDCGCVDRAKREVGVLFDDGWCRV